VRRYRLENKGQKIPCFHYDVIRPELTARFYDMLYRLFELFRGPVGRTFILKILFSRVGTVLDRLNVIRKNVFCKYHGN